MRKEKHERLGFENEYSENRFREKVTAYARTAGKEVVEKALWLYYSAQHPRTPAWAKSVIYGALGYFIFPLDAIPDLTPIAGYADDLGVLVAALATVPVYEHDETKAEPAARIEPWSGPKGPGSVPARMIPAQPTRCARTRAFRLSRASLPGGGSRAQSSAFRIPRRWPQRLQSSDDRRCDDARHSRTADRSPGYAGHSFFS